MTCRPNSLDTTPPALAIPTLLCPCFSSPVTPPATVSCTPCCMGRTCISTRLMRRSCCSEGVVRTWRFIHGEVEVPWIQIRMRNNEKGGVEAAATVHHLQSSRQFWDSSCFGTSDLGVGSPEYGRCSGNG
jgi:hypothetical protein